MKAVLIFSIAVFAFGNEAKAQRDVDPEQMIGFGYYASGLLTEPVNRFNDLISKKKYKQISKALDSSNSAERFLAVVTLERLDSLGVYKLLPNEKTSIAQIKLSTEEVSVCSGCTYFAVLPLKDLFTSEMRSFSQWWLDRTITDLIRQKK